MLICDFLRHTGRSFLTRSRRRSAARRRGSRLCAPAEVLEDRTLLASQFDNFVDVSRLDNGQLAFTGTTTTTTSSGDILHESGVYLADGGVIRTLVDVNTPVGGELIRHGSFGAPHRASGSVAFRAETGGSDEVSGTGAIYTSLGASVERIIAEGVSLDGNVVERLSLDAHHGQAFDGDTIVFTAQFDDNTHGIYRADAPGFTPSSIAQPGGVGNFVTAPLVDDGTIVFLGGTNGGDGGYFSTTGGSLTLLVRADARSGSSETFAILDPFFSFNDGHLVFRALTTAAVESETFARGLYRRDPSGEISVVADEDTPVPDGSGNFTDFGLNPAISEDGEVVFVGRSGSFQGLYLSSDTGEISKLVDSNTPYPGSAEGTFGSLEDPSIESGRVAFKANRRGGESGEPDDAIFLLNLGSGAITTLVTDQTAAPEGSAGEFHWIDSGGGDFDVAANWDPEQAPTAGDHTAVFDVDASYEVDFTRDEAHGSTSVTDGDVTFDLNGHTYRLTGEPLGDEFFSTVGLLVDKNATLTINDGAVRPDLGVTVGRTPGTQSVLHVHGVVGPNQSELTLFAGGLFVGHSSTSPTDDVTGILRITDGGVVDTSNVVGVGLAGQGEVSIRGVDPNTGQSSRLVVGSQYVAVGTGKSGTVHVADGGRVEVFGDMRLGAEETSGTGTLNVTGVHDLTQTQSTVSADKLPIGSTGAGEVNITDGGLVRGFVVVGGEFGGSGTLNVGGVNGLVESRLESTGGLLIGNQNLDGNDGPGAVTITEGGVITVDGFGVVVGIGGVGTLTIEGVFPGTQPNTSFLSTLDTTSLAIGAADGESTVTARDGALVGVSQTVVIGGFGDNQKGTFTVEGVNASTETPTRVLITNDLEVGIDGMMNILDGGHVAAGRDLLIGTASGTASGQGAVTVQGVNSTQPVAHVSTLDVEGAIVGAGSADDDNPLATLDILDGGRVDVGQRGVLLGDTSPGRITVAGRDAATGSPSELFSTGLVTIGEIGAGELRVQDGASLTVNDLVMGVGAPGTLLVNKTNPLAPEPSVLIAGDLTLSDGGGALSINDATVEIQGSLTNEAPSKIEGNNATLKLGGSLFNGSFLIPGASPGTLTIDGDLVNQASGVIEIEIAGPTPGAEHDQLIVTGTAELGGTLEVIFLDGFVPQVGETFDFLDANEIVGQFDEIVIEGLPDGQEVDFDPLTGEVTTVRARPWTNPRNPLNVDDDPDNVVSVADLLPIIQYLRNGGAPQLPDPHDDFQPAPFLDPNGDGLATVADLLEIVRFLRAQFAGGEGEPATAEVVPSPTPAGAVALETMFSNGLDDDELDPRLFTSVFDDLAPDVAARRIFGN